ncbi:hypothetical protein NIES3585_09540 [Nodularia sp. NIES-3585]|nr:hypothetical protein NIES3585_09540 [Nodularia sp. NIES-3585]
MIYFWTKSFSAVNSYGAQKMAQTIWPELISIILFLLNIRNPI